MPSWCAVAVHMLYCHINSFPPTNGVSPLAAEIALKLAIICSQTPPPLPRFPRQQAYDFLRSSGNTGLRADLFVDDLDQSEISSSERNR